MSTLDEPDEPRTDIGLTAEERHLVRQAFARATGANGHDVNRTIHVLYLASDKLQREPDDQKMLRWREMSTKQLRAFVFHGDIARAERDCPIE